MAITQPTEPTPGAPPRSADPSLPPARARSARPQLGRLLAGGALAAVIVILAILVFAGGGGSDYKLEFAEADQLVRGDQVQVGGVPVGSVKTIELSHNFTAVVTIHVDSSLTPLHEGPRPWSGCRRCRAWPTATSRCRRDPTTSPSLSAGAKLPASATKPVTDLDQLFNTFNPQTRKGLQGFIQGQAEQYAGQGHALGVSTEYFPSALSATDHFFAELVRDQPTFTSFLVETAKAVTTIGARKDALSGLIEHANTTFQAIGSQQANLAQGPRQLPVTLRQGNRTFADLPATFSALKQLVDASKPTSKPLTTFFNKLRPLVTTATPVVGNFSLIRPPGPNNDLTDLVRALPQLARALTTASPAGVTSLKESVPITAFFGPYSPDLNGTLRTFGQAGSYYDANGHYAHLGSVFPDFTLDDDNSSPRQPPKQHWLACSRPAAPLPRQGDPARR